MKRFGLGAMKQFFGSHENKRDAKGRVSVPASFRAAWKNHPEMTLILRPSFIEGCVEAWPLPNYERFQAKVDAMPEMSRERVGLQTQVYSDAEEVELDGQGRMLITGYLAGVAGLSDAVFFMGRGDHFLIWEPAAGRAFRDASRAMAPKLSFGALG
ncbi:MAG: cell division/cell wall cluster transcriptional repressor MraZ [Rhodospirillales bacterium]|nr:cell division/cell wall cluster transcriptional repressor MraZ [Rhodospirillales bacterium]MDE2459436.1 cell division/cell wall cluster transcriptional repressor MraZ [Rhodospirillales bacterium]